MTSSKPTTYSTYNPILIMMILCKDIDYAELMMNAIDFNRQGKCMNVFINSSHS